MKTLVTGASGFIGSAVVRQLLKANHEVKVLVRSNSDRGNIKDLPVEIVIGDLTDPASLEQAVKGCSVMFHAAADYRLWVRRPEKMYEVNVTGTVNIMKAALAARVERIVYTSSVATLGACSDSDEAPVDETSRAELKDMVGHYKRSKFLAEAEVRRMVREHGLPSVIVSPSTPIGPRDIKPTPTGRIIVDAASGRMPAYVDTGLNWVHVDDVAEGHLLALERGRVGERYILGSKNMTLKEVLHELADITGRKPPRIRLPHNLILPLAHLSELWGRTSGKKELRVTVDGVRMAKKFMYFSSEKARRELEYRPRPVREGLRDSVEWFHRQGFLQKKLPAKSMLAPNKGDLRGNQ
jgi:dihydroflavonol-4-reductase